MVGDEIPSRLAWESADLRGGPLSIVWPGEGWLQRVILCVFILADPGDETHTGSSCVLRINIGFSCPVVEVSSLAV